MTAKIAEVECNACYIRFFSTEWNRILGNLENLYSDRNRYRSDLLQAIAEAYDRILLACGLDISGHEQGFYVDVKDTSEF